MSHSSDKPLDVNSDFEEAMARQIMDSVNRAKLDDDAERLGLGATGEFPEGQLAPHDEGEIKMAVTSHDGKVVINFGKPVAFLGMTPDQAIYFAGLIKQHAEKLKRG